MLKIINEKFEKALKTESDKRQNSLLEDLEDIDSDRIHEFEQYEDDSIQDWYWEDEKFSGKDGGYGLFIIGNSDYKPMLFTGNYDESIIKQAYDESSTKDEFIEKLKEITGKDYARTTLQGIGQGEWQIAYYPKSEFTKDQLDEIEAVYMGDYTCYFDTTDEVGGFYILGNNREPLKQQLAKQAQIPVDKVRVKIITGYHQVPDYEYLDENLNESVSKELVDLFAYEYGISKAEAKKKLSDLKKEDQDKKLDALKGVIKNDAKAEIETEDLHCDENKVFEVTIYDNQNNIVDWFEELEGCDESEAEDKALTLFWEDCDLCRDIEDMSDDDFNKEFDGETKEQVKDKYLSDFYVDVKEIK